VMVLAQGIVNIFTVLSFSVMNALTLNPDLTSDPITAIKVRFAATITILLYYFYFGVRQRVLERFRR
jgi:hypothetical protein